MQRSSLPATALLLRDVIGLQPTQITLGAGVQNFQAIFTIPKPTKWIVFGCGQIVTTVPLNDPLTAVWLTSIRIVVNGKNVVEPMSLQNYIDFVQNTELKDPNIISNGQMLWKLFKDPLMPGDRVEIYLIVNTLALGTFTPAATAVLQMCVSLVDAERPATGNKITRYKIIPTAPQPAGVTAGQIVPITLGTFMRTEKWVFIISESPAGTPVDTFLGRLVLRSDQNEVANINNAMAKQIYQLLSDSIATPVGFHVIKLPGPGVDMAASSAVDILLTPYATDVAAVFTGVEVYDDLK